MNTIENYGLVYIFNEEYENFIHCHHDSHQYLTASHKNVQTWVNFRDFLQNSCII